MKRVLLIGVCVVSMASVAFAGGSIQVFSDPGGASCSWVDVAAALQPVYVFHVASTGATAGEWTLVPPATWAYLGESSPFTLVIGSSINGVSISYQACLMGTFQVSTVNFFGSGLEPPCTLFGIEGVQFIDCDQGREFPNGGKGRVNPDGTCECDVPVQETTWGGIKALYN